MDETSGTAHEVMATTALGIGDAVPITLTVLTFNLWGIFNAKMRTERMVHFASKVAHYDVILLQEQFTAEDFDLIRQSVPDEVRATRYFRRFPSSFYGSGCAVISRYPIRSAMFYTFPLQGLPEMVLHGDFFANKGAALVKVDVPVTIDGVYRSTEVLLYTTHLVAVYQKVSRMTNWRHERYLPYRLSQAIALADFVANTSRPSDAIVIGGDFNSSQRSLEVQLLRVLLKRRGYVMHSVLPAPSMRRAATPDEVDASAQARMLYTFSDHNAFNAMSTSYFKLLRMEADVPNQIDHIFFSANTFTLTAFDDCPDLSPRFPRFRRGDGTLQPTGVVVFTENEVAPAVADVDACACARGGVGRGAVEAASRGLTACVTQSLRVVGHASRLLSCRRGGSDATDDGFDFAEEALRQQRFPLSDHYGVAARLVLWVPSESTPAGGAAPPDCVSLSEDEVWLLNVVQDVLQQHCAMLRRHVTLSRYLTGTTLLILLTNVALMFRASVLHERVSAQTMQHVYELASGQRPQPSGDTAPPPRKDGAKAAVLHRIAAVAGWVQHRLAPQSAAPQSSAPAVTISANSFRQLARDMRTHLSATHIVVFSGINIATTLIGFTSFGIGMIQRIGNAHILEEQLRTLREI